MKWFTITVYHRGTFAGSETIKARDYHHACKLGLYTAVTIAKDNVHPSQFDSKLVTFNVE